MLNYLVARVVLGENSNWYIQFSDACLSMEDYSGYGDGEEEEEEIMQVVEKALTR